jgi:hypothetical protein
LQISGGTAAAAGTIILKTAGYFAPPFWLDRKIAFGKRGYPARNRRVSEAPERGVAKTAKFTRIAVDGAALLTGFYHRSVLRCGCLAERKSGVAAILPAERFGEQKCGELLRIGYPRQPPRGYRNQYNL